ncbi:MAG: exodeoxyribonuclease VII small subunit [Candidatus Aphodomorpha sp.]|nr:exodeoxyribonuclease VII small subunit [bacterium]
MEQEQTYEQAVARLEQIVKLLESGEGSLEEMIGLYQEGMRLHDRCAQMLDGFEKKLTTLRAEKEG